MNNKLTLSDIAGLLAERSGKDRKAAEEFLRELIAVVSDGLFVDRLVKIKGLGTFKIIPVEQRESVHVNTGERFVIPAHYKYSFLPDKELRDTVNTPFSFFETTEIVGDADFSDLEESVEEETDPDEESVDPTAPAGDSGQRDAGKTDPFLAREDKPASDEEKQIQDRTVAAKRLEKPGDGPVMIADAARPAKESPVIPAEERFSREKNTETPDKENSVEKNERTIETNETAIQAAANKEFSRDNDPSHFPGRPEAGSESGPKDSGAVAGQPPFPQEKAEEQLLVSDPAEAETVAIANTDAKAKAEKQPGIHKIPETEQVVFPPFDPADVPDNAGKMPEKETEKKNGKIPPDDTPVAGDKSFLFEITGKNAKEIGEKTSGKSDRAFYRREFFLAAVILAAFIGVSVLLYQGYIRQPVKTVPAPQTAFQPDSAAKRNAPEPSFTAAAGGEAVRGPEEDSLSVGALPAGTEKIPQPADSMSWPAAGTQTELQDALSPATPDAAAVNPPPNATGGKKPAVIGQVKIASGDRLTLIALKYYGHKFFWVYIYEANKDVIRNPNNVPIGTVLKIPAPETYGIDAKDRASIARAAALQTKILQNEE